MKRKTYGSSPEWTAWKAKYVSGSGSTRVVGENGNTRSVEMGIGMLLTVYFGEQALFDQLYDYVKSCRDSHGLMYGLTVDKRIVNTYGGSYTSADEDMALALIFAHKKWGSDGPVKYETEAKNLLEAIRMYDFTNDGVPKQGDSFTDTQDISPSQFAPGWYEIFRKFSGNSFWDSAKNKSYTTAKKVMNSTTGLVPNSCNHDGQSANSTNGVFGYDAIWYVWRMAVSYSWYGHKDAKTFCDKTSQFFKGVGAGNIVNGYTLQGNPAGSVHVAAFTASAAAGTMAGTDKQLAADFYTECLATTNGGLFYDNSLRLLTLMYMTGNLQNLYVYANWELVSIGVE